MIFEIASSLVMGGVVVGSYYFEKGAGGNDHQKIIKIARNCGLITKDRKELRIHRRTNKGSYNEYVYQIPLGLSSIEFINKLDHFQDGLNIKRNVLDISLTDFKSLDWKKDVIKQLRVLLEKKRKLRKEVEIKFDGMLIFRIHKEPLTTNFPYDESLFSRLKDWEVPVGVTRDGELIKHDFDKVAHLIDGGATDYGKSNWLKSTITTLVQRKPNDVKFTLIDLKGGLSFNRFKAIRQLESLATNPVEALEALKNVQEEMNVVMNRLAANGFEDVKEAGYKERHFVIIDEAADIADDNACQEIITDIARRGRAAGFRLIYATQYPTSEVIKSQVKRNCVGRLCFVVDSATASRVVLDQEGAESLPLVQGRAIYKTVRSVEVQTPYIKNDFIERTIEPHINIRPRKESIDINAKNCSATTTDRKYSLIIEET
ncbi:FtsK/SpoIIIE domain-containing protein [Priestia sp. JV24]|uniref:FtsK/SpoIIIE domain-containing protein n=1 Tax=Priestia TaxID=2800373 RepID=UPI0021D64D2C|nr:MULTISPECIES: FtsK/SpoIIIE domain-containing protein [Priestia]MCU7712609.1 FtsK/SpoIIIE domain-containing protein [Priestia megaterium]MCW1043813.1 FtsK/SpoIIIE domain-containing protein [Priestia sp. JV24]